MVPRLFVGQDTQPWPEQNDDRTATMLNFTCDLSIIFNNTMEYNKKVEAHELGNKEDIQRRLSLLGELQACGAKIPRENQIGRPFDPSIYYLRLESFIHTAASSFSSS